MLLYVVGVSFVTPFVGLYGVHATGHMTKGVLGSVILASGTAIVLFADPGLKLAWWRVGDYPQYPPPAAAPHGRVVSYSDLSLPPQVLLQKQTQEEIDSTRAYLKRLVREEQRHRTVRVRRELWHTRKEMLEEARLGTATVGLSLFVLYWWVLGMLGALYDTDRWLKKRRNPKLRNR